MAFESLAEFLEMGRHGIYVWSAYSFCFVALFLLILLTLSKRRNVRRALYKRFLKDKAI